MYHFRISCLVAKNVNLWIILERSWQCYPCSISKLGRDARANDENSRSILLLKFIKIKSNRSNNNLMPFIHWLCVYIVYDWMFYSQENSMFVFAQQISNHCLYIKFWYNERMKNVVSIVICVSLLCISQFNMIFGENIYKKPISSPAKQ